MRRYIVLGINENQKYMYYVPLVFWAWRHYDWVPLLFSSGDPWDLKLDLIRRTFDKFHEGMTAEMKQLYRFDYFQLNAINGYKSETLAQVSRLYGALAVKDDRTMLMTSDCDMLPLSNYWNPNDLNVTCYGRDLTDYHYPICYAAMTARKWREIMMLISSDYHECIQQDLEERPKGSNAWLWDQDILTERLNKYGKKLLHLIPRGIDRSTGYPLGRVDRSNWHLNHTQLIDAHLPHDILTNDESYKKVCTLLAHVWPTQDFSWYYNYHREFKKLL